MRIVEKSGSLVTVIEHHGLENIDFDYVVVFAAGKESLLPGQDVIDVVVKQEPQSIGNVRN
ncbi:hypothetical protein [Glutamicibacter arilaitensis]|uniref:Uncharacterized protein n=1 Tax=Glutamicibacter arilaitensis TaxID=256701 RepID=A0A2N7S711_9MICC|nr:hypothetical protein [Glutamicibacter arilaitensis]PMQ21931.1 hypothetical protein CIK84_10590 [Glutamicibacter arilaitensis]